MERITSPGQLPDSTFERMYTQTLHTYDAVNAYYPELPGEIFVLLQDTPTKINFLSYLKPIKDKSNKARIELDDLLLRNGSRVLDIVKILQQNKYNLPFIADDHAVTQLFSETAVAGKDDCDIQHRLIGKDIKPITVYKIPDLKTPTKKPVFIPYN